MTDPANKLLPTGDLPPAYLIFDGHLDLAWNAVAFDRDQTLSLQELRLRESIPPAASGGTPNPGYRGPSFERAASTSWTPRGSTSAGSISSGSATGGSGGASGGSSGGGGTSGGGGMATVCLPELRRAGVAVVHATIFTRTQSQSRPGRPLRQSADYATPSLTHAAACAQLGYYQLLERQGHVRLICDADDLAHHWQQWERQVEQRTGIILLMECADPIVEPAELDWWHSQGLRGLSLSHVALSAYAAGNDCPASVGGLTHAGRMLLKHMTRLGVALDLSHLSDLSFDEAFERFEGPIYASHSNCRKLAPGNRQLGDRHIARIADRDGVIGVVLCNSMLTARHTEGRAAVSLQHVAEHIDHICQVTGSIDHVGIGSDLDGGFGRDHTPQEIESIASIRLLPEWLVRRGFGDDHIRRILGTNWLEFWKQTLSPEPKADPQTPPGIEL